MRTLQRGALALVAAALAIGLAGGEHGARSVAAQSAEYQTILVTRVSTEDPIGKSFALMVTPATPLGTEPDRPTPVAGTVQVCGAPVEGFGRLVALFDDDSAIDLTAPGCDQVEVNAGGITLQSMSGSWNVVVRRLSPAAPETFLTAQPTPRRPLGANLSLMIAAETAAGEAPEAVEPYSGRIEVCATAPAGAASLLALFNDDEAFRFAASGCQQGDASAVSSATFIARGGDWSVVVRRLP